MGTKFIATATAETFSNPSHTVPLIYRGGAISYSGGVDGGGVEVLFPSFVDSREPYNGFVEQDTGNTGFDPDELMFAKITGKGLYYFEIFSDNSVDYGLSNSSIAIDLTRVTQHGGYAEGDVLIDIAEVTGSIFDDVIRGSNVSDYPLDSSIFVVNGSNTQSPVHLTIFNPGENVLNGGERNDVLEGRGGSDVLNGGPGFDFASYESSPAAVTVQLAGGGQSAIATGADATGDVFSSIEGLIGSRFGDHLTGNSENNLLAGGLGNDVLDGRGGSDTADYSRDHFFDIGDTPDRVVVRLGLNFAQGTAAEFNADIHNFPVISYNQVSTDTLISIESVRGSGGPDEIIGNEQINNLDGNIGDDTLDGGFGNDLLIGGLGNDTVSFASHDTTPLAGITVISLGLNGADGNAVAQVATGHGIIGFTIVESDVLRGFENVTGSNRSETINGNEQNNTLAGRGGNDSLNGGAGNDAYDVHGPANIATGSDRIFDESGTADQLLINSLADVAGQPIHDGFDLLILLTTGSVRIVDHFNGHAVENLVTADGKSVVLATGLIGGNLPGIIVGTDEDETLDGQGGDDLLYGGKGKDVLLGGDGDDLLVGDKGNDFLTGGAGADTFVFEKGSGHDTITDFEIGIDHLRLDDGMKMKHISVVRADHGTAFDVTLEFDGGAVTLQNINPIHDWQLLLA